MTHRQCFFRLAVFAFCISAATAQSITSQSAWTLDAIKAAVAPSVRCANQPTTELRVKVEAAWQDNRCSLRLVNHGNEPAKVREIVVMSMPLDLPADTRIWGEGFTMLSQTAGTLGKPVGLGGYTDRKHYRIPQPADATTVYGALTLSPPNGSHMLMAFTSCKRFIGSFNIFRDRIEAILDIEKLTIPPGQSWELEEFTFIQGSNREELLADLADRIGVHHQPLKWSPVPTGWCSWYCFRSTVTAEQIEANLEAIPKRIDGLRFFQIDDGFQSAVGDWLTVRKGFGAEMDDLCRRFSQAKFEPAVWVAPFVAEKNSRILREHPDWFIKNDAGEPLRSDTVTFGGWRNGPWYVLDGTNPAAAEHLEKLFRTMHRDWGCTYFKLDGNFWGAIHGGRHHDPNATRIEAYRRGMEAILRGAGNSFILGCNHPIWPSFGLIHGSRNSDDISAKWGSIRQTGIQCFSRNWQNGRLWLNDPDTVMLAGKQPDNELLVRANTIIASGGLVLSGDDLASLPDERLAILRKLLPPTGVAARFGDDTFTVGTIERPDGRFIVMFNWSEVPEKRSARLPNSCRVTDFWTGEDLGIREGTLDLNLAPRSSRLLRCLP